MRTGALPRPVWALDAELNEDRQPTEHYLGSLPRLSAQVRGDPGGLLFEDSFDEERLEEHFGTVRDTRGLASYGERWAPSASGNESDASGVSSAASSVLSAHSAPYPHDHGHAVHRKILRRAARTKRRQRREARRNATAHRRRLDALFVALAILVSGYCFVFFVLPALHGDAHAHIHGDEGGERVPRYKRDKARNAPRPGDSFYSGYSARTRAEEREGRGGGGSLDIEPSHPERERKSALYQFLASFVARKRRRPSARWLSGGLRRRASTGSTVRGAALPEAGRAGIASSSAGREPGGVDDARQTFTFPHDDIDRGRHLHHIVAASQAEAESIMRLELAREHQLRITADDERRR